MNSNKTKKYHFYRNKFQNISMSRKPVSIINLNVAVPVCRQQKNSGGEKGAKFELFLHSGF